MKRKLLALLLALVMVLGLLPAALVPDTAVAETIDQTIVEGGAILHCFDWSYNEIKAALPDIAAAGYVAIQTSPVQQPKDYNSAWTGGDQWWKLYQPLGFTIADGDSWLGTKAELTELCTVAENEYGIKVIVDIVANHLANKTGGGGWAQVNENIDPDLYDPKYFHTSTDGVNDGSRANMTQNQMGMPDLNTANEDVQQKVYDLLVECVKCGVDGFRFDAAKHIELPNDPVGSDFWPAILNGGDTDGDIYGIRRYAGANNLFIYGESLSGNAGETWVDEYTSYMALTDSDYGGRIRSAIGGTNAGMLGDGRYVRCEDARGNVVWVESHDTYEDGGSVWLTDDQIIKAWAIVGARADSTALYFARPNEIMGKASSDITWKSTEVAEVNKFKNHFVGMSEFMHSDYGSKVAWVERGGNGVVISKLDGAGSVYLYVCQMQDGNYKDQVTGNTFTVANGMITGTVGEKGVAVIYNTNEDAVNATPSTQSDYIRTSPLYLIPNNNWKTAGARFAMYVNDTNGHSAWADMTEVADGVFAAELPVGDWTNVIFLRMNPAFDENRWNRPEDGDNKPVWNQTADLGHAFTGNCYTINEESWSDGAWGIYNPYAGYYLVGNMNGWTVNQNYRLDFNPNATDDKKYSIKADLNQFSSFKIVYSADGEQKTTWYPDGMDNDYNSISAAGTYNIYFRPDGQGGSDWYCGCIKVDVEQTSTYDNAGFYLVGTMTNWKVKAAYKLNGSGNEYSIDKHLSVMDQFKVVYSVDGTETSIWYPDPSPNYGADDATRIISSGVYHISFRPNYDGGEGWFNNCIKVSGCVTVNIVGNSDLIEWSLYKSEEGMTDWEEFSPYGQPEMTKLEDGDNVVPVGWYVGFEATTKVNNAVEFSRKISYTNSDGEGECVSGKAETTQTYRTSVGPLGEGPVTITLYVNRLDPNPTFTTQSLTLGGEIGVNFYMDLSTLTDAEKASSYMTFEVGTENKKVVSKANYDATKTGENGTYGFTCYVNAIEMADIIKPVFHYKLSGDSEEKTVERSAYSVRMYVVDSLNPNNTTQPDATTAALEKKLIEYGHYVQIYLQQLRGWAFGTDYVKIEPYDNVAQDYSNKYDAIKAELAGQGHAISRPIINNSVIERITYSLVLDSETTIRVYIKPAAGYNGEITVDGAATIATKLNDGRYLVEIKGIGAHELGETYTININNGAASVQVSAMSYVLGMLEKEDATNNVAKDAVCSIYYYWKAALNYLSEHQS